MQLLPNLLTLTAICAGLTAIRFAIHGAFGLSVALILVAAFLDGLDGRLARILRSESDLGAELDSLADFLNFGVAPALTVYLWALQDSRSAGWIAVLVYAICGVMRLARFNVGIKSDSGAAASPGPAPSKRFFTGVPAPAGAMLALLPLYLAFMSDGRMILPDPLIVAWLLICGGLMISRLPTFSFKTTTIYADHARFVLVGVVALLAALVTFPWVTLVVFDLLYLAGIALAWRAARRDGLDRPDTPVPTVPPDQETRNGD